MSEDQIKYGCDLEDQKRLTSDPSFFKKSQQDYDWLGHGMYFWENNENKSFNSI